jgi:hypothetical protein
MMFDIKSHLVLSNTSGSNQIPFYLQPTLGGNDIDANVTLRGWDDYRFRDRDAALIQAEADYIVWDPFGVYAFYDGGTVAPNHGGLSFPTFATTPASESSLAFRAPSLPKPTTLGDAAKVAAGRTTSPRFSDCGTEGLTHPEACTMDRLHTEIVTDVNERAERVLKTHYCH